MSEIVLQEAPMSARWSVGGSFLESLAARDYQRMAATLDPTIRFRALLPPGPSHWQGSDAVTGAFRAWFGGAEEFELVEASVGEVGGLLHLAWRIRVRPAPFDIGEGWHLIEQQAYAETTSRIMQLDLLCSGFHPDGV